MKWKLVCLACASSLLLSDTQILPRLQAQDPRHWCIHEFHRALGALFTANSDA
ncbi:hypothetical protein D3C81_1686940 [compost metagenome]